MADFSLLPAEDESLRKSLQECQAHVGALNLLLVELGLVTETQLRQAQARADRYFEERRTQANTRREQDFLLELAGELRHIRDYLTRAYPNYEVTVALPQIRPEPHRDGIFVQLVPAPGCPNRSDDRELVEAVTEQIYFRLQQSPLTSWLVPVTTVYFSREQLAKSPLAVRYATLLHYAQLVEGPGDGQPGGD